MGRSRRVRTHRRAGGVCAVGAKSPLPRIKPGVKSRLIFRCPSSMRRIVTESSLQNAELLEPDEDDFFVEQPPEHASNDIWLMMMGLLSPGTGLCMTHRGKVGVHVNMLLAWSVALLPAVAALLDIFPVYVCLLSVVMILAVWIGSMVHVIAHASLDTEAQSPWRQAGVAFLSFWFPLVVALYAGGIVVQCAWVSNDAMLPGMEKGDIIFINRTSYRRENPHHGDLVWVEERVREGGQVRQKSFLGRVIGCPGDEVQLFGMQPSVNGERLQQFMQRADLETWRPNTVAYEIPFGVAVSDEMSEPAQWYPVVISRRLLYSSTNAVKLEADYYYILEDNRDAGDERSRRSYGSIVHRREIHGQPQFVLYNSESESFFSRYNVRLR